MIRTSTLPDFPPCPHLPDAPAAMDWRALNELRAIRGPELYLRCLRYGQYLWLGGQAARAILSVDRGLLCEMEAGAEALHQHPLPYDALVWMIAHTPAGIFIGNPRVHYQHLADRVRGEREEQRRWRAWAVWHLARLVRPDLPGDPRHLVREPTVSEIDAALVCHGIPAEAQQWRGAARYAEELHARIQNSRT